MKFRLPFALTAAAVCLPVLATGLLAGGVARDVVPGKTPPPRQAPPPPEARDLAFPNATIVIKYRNQTNSVSASQRYGTAAFAPGPIVRWSNCRLPGYRDDYVLSIAFSGKETLQVNGFFQGDPVTLHNENELLITVR